MRALEAKIIGREYRKAALVVFGFERGIRFHQTLHFSFGEIEHLACGDGIGPFEIIGAELLLFREANLAITQIARPAHIEDVIYSLQIRGDAIESVGKLDGNRLKIETAGLLEVSELGDFQTIK